MHGFTQQSAKSCQECQAFSGTDCLCGGANQPPAAAASYPGNLLMGMMHLELHMTQTALLLLLCFPISRNCQWIWTSIPIPIPMHAEGRMRQSLSLRKSGHHNIDRLLLPISSTRCSAALQIILCGSVEAAEPLRNLVNFSQAKPDGINLKVFCTICSNDYAAHPR